jgi:tetratricopeptide (TPR) repeat protein
MKAMEIDPKNPYFWTFYNNGGAAHLMLGHDHEAVEWLRKSLEAEPTNIPSTYFWLASAYANDGQSDNAKQALQQYLRRRPGRTIAIERAELPSNSPAFLKQFEHVLDGLRKAEMPAI